MKLKQFLFIISIIVSFLSFSQNSLLDSAYQNQSKELLETYLENWHQESNSPQPVFDDTTKMVYDVFEAFYHPNNLSHYNGNGSFFGNGNCKYLILPNELKYSVSSESSPILLDSLKAYEGYIIDQLSAQLKNQEMQTLSNFRPNIKTDSSTILYLSASRKDEIYSFLGPTRSEVKDNHLALSKANWLSNNGNIYISHNEWGAFRSKDNEWIILSAPQVEYLFVDPVNKIASVYFSIGDLEMGVAYFASINKVWTRTNLIIACTDCE